MSVLSSELIRIMFGIEKPRTYGEGNNFPTIAQTKKYDFADSIAVDIVSPLMITRSRMLVASRERNEGKWEEVMLKDIAGVTQAGNLNNFVEAKPKASDSNV